MNKKFIAMVTSVSLIASVSLVLAASTISKYDESKIRPSWGVEKDTQVLREDKKGMIMPSPVLNPEPVYKDNEKIPTDSYYDINKKIDTVKYKKENVELVMAKAMKYEDYCKMEGKKTDEITMLSPKRMLWIVKTKRPNGVQIPISEEQKQKGESGLVKNVTVTELYDAETGEYFGYNVVPTKE